MSSETTAGWTWSDDVSSTSWNENSTASTNNRTLTVGGSANAILAEETIKIIYLVIGQFSL